MFCFVFVFFTELKIISGSTKIFSLFRNAHYILSALLVPTDAFSARSLSVYSVSFKGTKNFVMLKCYYFTVPFLKVTENIRPRTQLHPLLSVMGTKDTRNHCTGRAYPVSFITRIKRKIHSH